MRALSQSLAREFGPQGVHVSHVIVDGVIDIPRTKEWDVGGGKPDAKISSSAVSLVYDTHESNIALFCSYLSLYFFRSCPPLQYTRPLFHAWTSSSPLPHLLGANSPLIIKTTDLLPHNTDRRRILASSYAAPFMLHVGNRYQTVGREVVASLPRPNRAEGLRRYLEFGTMESDDVDADANSGGPEPGVGYMPRARV